MKKILFFLLLSCIALNFNTVFAQQPKQLDVKHSDFGDYNQVEIPDAGLLTGNVLIHHDGIVITCNKAYYFQKENYVKLFGNVQMVQGDTLYLNSKYAEYSGNEKKAFATGNPVMRSPDMTLTTDTINFDRNKQEAYYRNFGRIVNKENTLTSISGRYYANQKKSQFLTTVTITNPEYTIKSDHVDYYHTSGHAYLFGPSTITGKNNFIYTEKGFYNSKKNVGHFLRKSYIRYDDRLIEGDSLYYDRKIEFASATNNVKITDTINKGIIKGHYGEVYKQKDSMFVTKRAVAINLVENDSVYIHGKRLMITGKKGNQIIRAFDNARFYKTDMSGKCDSIHSSTKKALTQLLGRPVIWNAENQMTGDVIHLIGNNATEKLDSLKVLNNAFLVSKDSLGKGYNQVKGQNLYGKFRENKLYEVDIVKNTEVIYYVYDELELTGIEKKKSSSINITFEDNKINVLTSFKSVESELYPESELPENTRKLRGFIWRGDEIIRSKDDIFPTEENELNDMIIKESNEAKAKKNTPMEVRKETLEYDKKNPAKKSVQ
ncbi:lipopolysaccharide export system protein LptA [Flavobacterium arsenatis]|uniref:Lipopolysaccharide export system protein LptA n=1 Tax=Flavobacterium arsenatis TaxID=1484332 RepID=A0ABU1TMN2_9FLAO|nr:OstA-like protein [Flavobacterium arsenatis]MDR6967231.1 lipopolysaccharide export system protein LptA [Flavobacterium arsenatis]